MDFLFVTPLYDTDYVHEQASNRLTSFSPWEPGTFVE